MPAAKPFSLRRNTLSTKSGIGSLSFGMVLLFASAAPAQRLPLPPVEQTAVNHAIDRGVEYLKKAQQKSGTWAKPNENARISPVHGTYAVGYAALPGLTLLECGIPASDPIIQQAARFVRSRGAKLDTTYELSLSILFLDRLGDPTDEKLIQTFALRLIAGQSATGGWGYKCPIPSAPVQKDLLTALKFLDSPTDLMPAIAKEGGDKPGQQLLPFAQQPVAPTLEGAMVRPTVPSLIDKTSRGSPGQSSSTSSAQPNDLSLSDRVSRGSLSQSHSMSGSNGARTRADLLSPEDLIVAPLDQQNDCLGLGMLENRYPESLEFEKGNDQNATPPGPNDRAGNGKPSDAQTQRPSAKRYVIPERLRNVAALQDPTLHVMQDPMFRNMEPVLTTTDNSNSQFAILALWTAQRHDVPMKRCSNLIVRRYLTSQNADGSWGYHYQFGGGGNPIRLPNAMTCVGLIGLAVGHGLAAPRPAGQPVQDARIVNGLIALSKSIGQPVEAPAQLPMQNLYFLWSLERVAVLYNLPTIGDKDWYRWGAQVLVRNQEFEGHWVRGMQIGDNPTINTCLALLFLKKVNLVKDLTAKLPFTGDELNKTINQMIGTTEPTEPPKKKLVPAVHTEPTKPAEPERTVTAPRQLPEAPPVMESASENTGSSKKIWLLLSAVVFVTFSGGGLLFILLALNRRAEPDGEEKSTKRKKRSVSRESKGSATRSPSTRA